MDYSCLVNVLERDSNFARDWNDVFFCKAGLWGGLHQRGETTTGTVLGNNPKLCVHRKCFENNVDILRAIVFERLQNACFSDELFDCVVFGIHICLVILDIDFNDFDSTYFLGLPMLA